MDCELLFPEEISRRGFDMLSAMRDSAEAAGIRLHVSRKWEQRAPWLMTYGLGHLGRRPWIEAHKSRGGRVIGWDLGYWARESAMRLTFDHDHPQQFLRPQPGERWQAQGITLREDFREGGPIIVCGLGRKQRAFMKSRGIAWEIKKIAQARQAYPGRTVLYRPKAVEKIPGVPIAYGTIEQALSGASLAIVHHSNVAIDCAIAGVPCVAEDGAGAALFSSDIKNPTRPSREQRLAFLQSLAYFNWKPSEALDAWKFIRQTLSDSTLARAISETKDIQPSA